MNQNNTLTSTLLSKYKSCSLANFYIIEPNIDDLQATNDWVNNLLKKICPGKDPLNHSDILILTPKKKNYSIEEIKMASDFSHYRATELNTKFVIITNSDALSEVHYNKLLKTLEDPPIELTVFLVHNSKKQLIETIRSRGIFLRPIFKQENLDFIEIDKIMDLAFQHFQEEIEKLNITPQRLVQYVSHKINRLTSNFRESEIFLKKLQDLESDLLFHNSTQSIKLKVYALLHSLTVQKVDYSKEKVEN